MFVLEISVIDGILEIAIDGILDLAIDGPTNLATNGLSLPLIVKSAILNGLELFSL